MISTITRGALVVWSRAARIPLRAAEQVARPEDPETWGPAVALEQAEAAVRDAVGGLLRDESLKDAARRQRTRIAQLQEAARKRAQADVLESRAQQQLDDATREVAADRADAQRRASAATAEVERKKQAAKNRAAADAAKRKEATAEAEAAHERRLAQEQAAAERKRLAEEAKVLQAKKTALVAEGEAIRLEDAAERVKERRKPAIKS